MADGWSVLCRRTNDPKLAFLERELTRRGIASRRDGHSFHAPILLVKEEDHEAAWNLLGEDFFGDGTRLDDIDDDNPVFAEDSHV